MDGHFSGRSGDAASLRALSTGFTYQVWSQAGPERRLLKRPRTNSVASLNTTHPLAWLLSCVLLNSSGKVGSRVWQEPLFIYLKWLLWWHFERTNRFIIWLGPKWFHSLAMCLWPTRRFRGVTPGQTLPGHILSIAVVCVWSWKQTFVSRSLWPEFFSRFYLYFSMILSRMSLLVLELCHDQFVFQSVIV